MFQCFCTLIQRSSGCFDVINETYFTAGKFMTITDGKSAGAIRISVGLASNFADVYRFVEFARSFLDKPADTI